MTGLYIVSASSTWYYILCLKRPDDWDLNCWMNWIAETRQSEIDDRGNVEKAFFSVFLYIFIALIGKEGGGHREAMTMNSLKMHNEQWPSRQSFDLPIPSNSQRISGILWEFVILGVLSQLMTLSCRCSLLTVYDLPLERASPLAWCWFSGRWDCDKWQMWQLSIIY